MATLDSRVLVSEAHRLLKELFRPGYRYHKCGVQLSQIRPVSVPKQMDLFEATAFKDAGNFSWPSIRQNFADNVTKPEK